MEATNSEARISISREDIKKFNEEAEAGAIEPDADVASLREAIELALPGLEKLEAQGFSQQQLWKSFRDRFGLKIAERTFKNYYYQARRAKAGA